MMARLPFAMLLSVAAFGLSAAPGMAADYSPVSCTAAVAYKGAALHPAPAPVPAAAAQPFTARLDAATIQRLEATFSAALQGSKAHAMGVAVGVPGQGSWAAQQGSDQPLFYWASVGKQATAAVVLQLVDEGRVGLSDPISRWVGDVPNGDAITIEHLLNHTSGLFSASEDLKVHRENRRLEMAAELEVLRRHGAMFCPGERWRYSNSGYSLLGRVVEQVDGRPLAQSIQARVIAPLRLAEMRALDAQAPIADIAAPHPDTAEPAIDVRAPGAAGPVASSALDMVRFEQAWLTGALLKESSQARLLRDLYPMFDAGTYYGLGTMLYDLPDRGRRLYWIGHSGGASGVKALSIYAPDQNVFVAVALAGDGSAEATANLLLKAVGDAGH